MRKIKAAIFALALACGISSHAHARFFFEPSYSTNTGKATMYLVGSIGIPTSTASTLAPVVTTMSAAGFTTQFGVVATTINISGVAQFTSTTTISGPLALPNSGIKAVSFTLSTETVVICSPTVSGMAITLPPAATLAGKTAFIKLVSTNSVTLTPNASEKIDSSSTYLIQSKNEFVSLQSDSLNWNILSRSIPVGTGSTYYGSSATVPSGWLLCDGSTISRTGYAGLFAVIGTTYGGGDGSTTFVLPDLRGISAVGSGTTNRGTSGQDATGSSYTATLGQYYQDQFQGHYHEIKTTVGTYVGHNSGSESIGIQWTDVGSSASGTRIHGKNIETDGTDGLPRASTYTRGPGLGVNFIIKY